MRLEILVEKRYSTDNRRIFFRVVEAKHGNRYALQCQCGVRDFIVLKVWTAFLQPFPSNSGIRKEGSHRELTNREAARLQSPAELIQVRCGCKGDCATIHYTYFKAKVDCTFNCHGRNGGA